jgi:antitoxin (DNA-binding transcriptional repressor) of toxin-antitoxin stability system
MTAVSVREFSYNPSAMFARAEKGETIEITRHGKVIATLVPGQQKRYGSRIAELEATGALRRSGKTTSDLDTSRCPRALPTRSRPFLRSAIAKAIGSANSGRSGRPDTMRPATRSRDLSRCLGSGDPRHPAPQLR